MTIEDRERNMDTGVYKAPSLSLRPADVRMSNSGGSEQDVGHAPKHKTTTDPSRPLKALIVEDDALIAYDLQMMLTDLDVEVVGIAMTEREAARLAALHQPDFATMDVVLRGECNGIDTAIRIYQTHGIRSLFVTGNVSPAARLRGAAAKPLHWLAKPIGFHNLKEIVRQFREDDPGV